MRNVADRSSREDQNTSYVKLSFPPLPNCARRARQATDDNMVHVHWILDN